MKTQSYSRFFQPFYVLFAGALGGGVVISWFFQNFPLASDPVGKAFASHSEFWVWVFLVLVTMGLSVIFILPAWGMFIWLFNRQVLCLDRRHQILEISKLILTAGFFLFILFWLLRINQLRSVGLVITFPQYHDQRMTIFTGVIVLVCLPTAMGMFLTYKASQELIRNIQDSGQSKEQLFPLTRELLMYRSILQNALVIIAILLSMALINSFALRAVIVEVYPQVEESLPPPVILVFGLSFTLILLLVYLPSHFALTEASQKLRDTLSPLGSLDDLDGVFQKRKQLDVLLQTNTGLLDNIKSGIITFAPLITSLLVALGIQYK